MSSLCGLMLTAASLHAALLLRRAVSVVCCKLFECSVSVVCVVDAHDCVQTTTAACRSTTLLRPDPVHIVCTAACGVHYCVLYSGECFALLII